MKISGVEVEDGAKKYWRGADAAPWAGVAFKNALAQLGLTLDTREIKSHGDLERHLFTEVASTVASNGYMEPQDVLLVASWKTDRSLPCIAMNEQVLGTLATKTRDAFADGLGVAERVRRLRTIHGIGVGVASALLTVFRSEEFSVVDWRALQTLRRHGESAGQDEFTDRTNAWWYENYELYLDGCLGISRREGVPLRDLDRFLWRWSRDHGKAATSTTT